MGLHADLMNTALSHFNRWKLGVLAAVAVTFLTSIPQLSFWFARLGHWQGSYVLYQEDETTYSAYVSGLIAGQPRRSDPYSGRNAYNTSDLAECHFSIQFVPAYLLTLFARVGGLSASTVFIVLLPICALCSSLAVYWLLINVSADKLASAVGVLVVLCLGALAGAQGELQALLGARAFHHFPFLRRYQPAIAFPLFFLVCGLVWRVIRARRLSSANVAVAAAASTLLSVLIFSYFFLWTTAFAWLAVLFLLHLTIRPENWKRSLWRLAAMAVLPLACLVPYFSLLSQRAPTMDGVLALAMTRRPDLLRAPEVLGAIAAALLAWGARRAPGRRWGDPAVIFTLSFALVPFVVFNQQVITGRSLQSKHYEDFIANYAALTALVLTAALFWRHDGPLRQSRKRAATLTTVICLGWGLFEASGVTARTAAYARMRDDMVPVLKWLSALDHAGGAVQATDLRPSVVLSTNLSLADNMPIGAPQPVLWAPAMRDFPGASAAEYKQRFYHYLYFCGVSAEDLGGAIAEGQFHVLVALFGIDRAVPQLTANGRTITAEERRAALEQYDFFLRSFSRGRAAQFVLGYVVAPAAAQPDWTNLDRWYERVHGEVVGDYVIYNVRLRS